MKKQIFSFSVDSSILDELGANLVENVHVAVSELVKNAYDADASLVTLELTYPHKSTMGPTIRITDNGSGMTKEEVKNYWMTIATQNKAENRISKKYGRARVGAKGIGRFSCIRLGQELKLTTVAELPQGGYEKTEIHFKWPDFKKGTKVTEKTITGTITKLSDVQTGTELLISGADKDEWGQRRFDYLQRQMTLLVANRGKRGRAPYKDDPGFNVILKAPDFSQGSDNLRDKLINSGWGTVTAKVDGRGNASYLLNAMGLGEKTYPLNKQFKHLKNISLTIGIIVHDRKYFRDTKVLSQGTAGDIINNWGGIHVRYNNARVYPYGEMDWLDIDKDRSLRLGLTKFDDLEVFARKLRNINPKRALLSLLSHKSHVGEVNINEKSTKFEMKISREGFVHSAAVDELIKFTRFAVDWATVYRDHYMRLLARQEAENAKKKLEDEIGQPLEGEKVFSKATEVLAKELKSAVASLSSDERQRVENIVNVVEDTVGKAETSKNSELAHLRLIASSATLLLVFTHEVRTLLGVLGGHASSIESLGKKVGSEHGQRLEKIGKELSGYKARLFDLAELTTLMGRKGDQEKLSKLALKDALDRAIAVFQLISNKYSISIQSDIKGNVLIGPILPAEIYAIFVNVLSNSIKSVIAKGGERKIFVTAHSAGGKCTIEILDSGVGLPEKHFNEVFTPFIADPAGNLYPRLQHSVNSEDDFISTEGYGLGLGIVREIVEVRKGAVQFRSPLAPWKACLEITI